MHLFVHACIQNEGEQEYKNCELDKNQVGQRSRSSGHTHVGCGAAVPPDVLLGAGDCGRSEFDGST